MEANLVKMRPQCFYSAVIENLKLDYFDAFVTSRSPPFQVNTILYLAMVTRAFNQSVTFCIAARVPISNKSKCNNCFM